MATVEVGKYRVAVDVIRLAHEVALGLADNPSKLRSKLGVTIRSVLNQDGSANRATAIRSQITFERPGQVPRVAEVSEMR